MKHLPILHWRHNEHDGGSNLQPHDCLPNRLFKAYERKHQSSAFVRRIHRWPVKSPHKESVPQKMIPFDDVIVNILSLSEWFGSCTLSLEMIDTNITVTCNNSDLRNIDLNRNVMTKRSLFQKWSFLLQYNSIRTKTTRLMRHPSGIVDVVDIGIMRLGPAVIHKNPAN